MNTLKAMMAGAGVTLSIIALVLIVGFHHCPYLKILTTGRMLILANPVKQKQPDIVPETSPPKIFPN